MSRNPFLLSSPQDMLAKSRRELALLKDHMNADTVFNFFVTAYHVMDYVKALGTVSGTAIDAMYADPDFDLCRFICTRGKHLRVERRPKEVGIMSISGAPNGTTINDVPLSPGIDWTLFCDKTEVKPVELAEAIIMKWERFFQENKIP